MRRRTGTIARAFLCAAICLIAVFLCACQKSQNETPVEETPTPIATPTEVTSPTPTFGFRDPTVVELRAFADSQKPGLAGEFRNVWNLAPSQNLETTVYGEGNTVASFRVMWEEEFIYVLVHVLDSTPDTSAKSVYDRDSVFIYINEDTKKSKYYGVGDAFYVVDRDGLGYLGTGASQDGYACCVYGDGTGSGYYAEVKIPLLTVTGRYDRMIGFDVRVNNASEGKLKHAIQWADVEGHTDVTLKGVGIISMD